MKLREHLTNPADARDLDAAWDTIQARRRRGPRRGVWVLGAIATVVLAALVLRPAPSTPRAPLDRSAQAFTPEVVTADDGTQIVLMPGARLVPLESAADVIGWRLEQGAAAFDVPHDPDRTFYVRGGDVRVVVVGTRFTVRRADDQLFVEVDRGTVRVERDGDSTLVHGGDALRVEARFVESARRWSVAGAPERSAPGGPRALAWEPNGDPREELAFGDAAGRDAGGREGATERDDANTMGGSAAEGRAIAEVGAPAAASSGPTAMDGDAATSSERGGPSAGRGDAARNGGAANRANARGAEANGTAASGTAVSGTAANGNAANGNAANGNAANGNAANGNAANGNAANGNAVSGTAANGATKNGATASGAAANGASKNGTAANGATANGTGTANGGTANGTTANGGAANGATAKGTAANGATKNGATKNGATKNGATATQEDGADDDDPLAAADRARAAGLPERATEILARFVADAPADPRAPLARFMLARVYREDLGDHDAAAKHLEVALAAGLPRPLEERALARLVESYVATNQRKRARAAAKRYVENFPKGARIEQIRRWAPPP